NTRSTVGRARDGVRRAQAGKNPQHGRFDRALPAVPSQLQGTPSRRIFASRAAEKRLRQDTQAYFTRAFLGSSETGRRLRNFSDCRMLKSYAPRGAYCMM